MTDLGSQPECREPTLSTKTVRVLRRHHFSTAPCIADLGLQAVQPRGALGSSSSSFDPHCCQVPLQQLRWDMLREYFRWVLGTQDLPIPKSPGHMDFLCQQALRSQMLYFSHTLPACDTQRRAGIGIDLADQQGPQILRVCDHCEGLGGGRDHGIEFRFRT